MPEGSLGSLFTERRGCDPTWVVVCPGASQRLAGLADVWGQIFPKWPSPEKGMLLNIPKSFTPNVLPSQQATFTRVFPGCPPRTAVRFNPDSYGDLTLPWGPVYMKVRVHLLRMRSPFPPVLWSSCAQGPVAFNARCSGGSFSDCQIPRSGDLKWGSELSLL